MKSRKRGQAGVNTFLEEGRTEVTKGVFEYRKEEKVLEGELWKEGRKARGRKEGRVFE